MAGSIHNSGGQTVGGYVLGGALGLLILVIGTLSVRAMLRQPTKANPATPALVGSLGTVVIEIPETGMGEVTISQPDRWLRVSAVAENEIAAGTTVVVLDVPSPDSVVVAESGF